MPAPERQPPATPPPQTTQRAEQLVTVETQQELDLLTGERVERIFVKLYKAARTSGLMAEISDRDWKTLTVLATYMNQDGYCYPSQGELAKALGVSRQMANDRVHSLAQFRFQGKPVMLMQDDQNRAGRGRFGGKRYRILPLASLKIFDERKAAVDQRSQGSTRPTVSSPLDTVKSTVSSPTVTVQLDTNKNQESLEQEQQQGYGSARATAEPRRKESVVVVSGQIRTRSAPATTAGIPIGSAPPLAQVAPPLSAVDLEAFGLAHLTNELTKRGVALAAAQKWMKVRTPEYIQQLLEYHDWCQEHRQGFIHDSGGWLTASLAKTIAFPENYLKAKGSAHRKAEQEARAAEEQARQQAKELQRRATELAQDPGDWAHHRLQTYEDSQKILGRPPLTEVQRREREAQYASNWIRQRDTFIAEHPEFAQLLGRAPEATVDVPPPPNEDIEATTQIQLKAWQQERHAAREEQSRRNEAARVARSPEEQAEDALRGLDDNADTLGQPRLRGSAREERQRALVTQFRTERESQQATGEASLAPSWKGPEGQFHGPDEPRRPNDQPAPNRRLRTPYSPAERSSESGGAGTEATVQQPVPTVAASPSQTPPR